MRAEPAVTVLTAVRNGARYLPWTIDSVLAQTMDDLEHLIVDDASTDGTVGIVEDYARRDDRVRLVRRTSSGGPYVAANEGLRHARGRYIARIDADDVAARDRLERQVAFLRSSPGLRAAAGFWQEIGADGTVDPRVRTIPTSPRVIPWFHCVRSGFIHSAACVERAALAALGGYRELPVAQDFRLWCDLSRQRTVGVVPAVVAYWRSHPASIGATKRQRQVDAVIDILSDHLCALSEETWTVADAATLFRAARAQGDLGAGLRALSRWETCWTRDGTLDRSDRRELARLTVGLRLRLIRAGLRREPVSSVGALAATGLRAMRAI